MTLGLTQQVAITARLATKLDRNATKLDARLIKTVREMKSKGASQQDIFAEIYPQLTDAAFSYGKDTQKVVSTILAVSRVVFPESNLSDLAKAANQIAKGTTLPSTAVKDHVLGNVRSGLEATQPSTLFYVSIPTAGACEYCVERSGMRVQNPHDVWHHPGCQCVSGVA